MKEYWKKIYNTRYFWLHLAKNDLKTKFRQSKLGLLWAVIQPLFLTIILSFVFSVVFKQSLGEYSMYILSGIVVWDLIQLSVVGAGNSLFASEQYIKQFNHPIAIYTLRYAIVSVALFLMELIALIVWVIIFAPQNIIIGVVTLPLTVLLYFPLVWGCSTVAGYSGAKYRDYSQIMALVMQMLYYISPVFFKQEMFMTNQVLKLIFEINPVTHLLNLIRAPFVYMKMPNLRDYVFVLIVDLIILAWAFVVNKKNEKKVIFYL